MFPRSIIFTLLVSIAITSAQQNDTNSMYPNGYPNESSITELTNVNTNNGVSPSMYRLNEEFPNQPPTDPPNVFPFQPEPNFSNYSCLTPQCMRAALSILENANFDVDPCDDFYEHVCGNYENTHTIPDNMPSIDPVTASSKQEVPLRLQRIIEDIDELRAPPPFLDIKIAFKNCIERQWYQYRYPNVDEKKRLLVAFMWRKICAIREDEFELSKYSFKSRHVFNYIQFPNNNPEEKIFILTTKPGIVPWNYLKEGLTNRVVQEYLTFMKFVLTDLGANQTRMDSDLMDILNFEITLANIVSPDDNDFFYYHGPEETTLGALKTDYPNLDFEDIGNIITDTSIIQVYESSKILANLNDLISRTPKWVLVSWQIWRTIVRQDVINRLGQNIYHTFEKFVRHNRDGTVQSENMWKGCATEVYSKYSFVLEALYHGQYLSEKASNDARKIFEDIRMEFIEPVQKADWLSGSTKLRVVNKIESMRLLAGHEKYMLDKESDPFYVDLKLSDGLLANNRANITKIMENPNELLYPFTKMVASYVNNVIILGAAVFTEALFETDRPAALNYGAFGRAIGHEMAHSFGHRSKWFDESGRVPRYPSWDPQSLENYAARTRCLEDQHKKYAFDEFRLNLTTWKTEVEDIADLMGVKAAYLAYKKNNPFDVPLPGLHYSSRQLFWVSLAASYCSKNRPQYMIHRTYIGKHSFEKARVNVPLSNLQEFTDDFQCEADSKMNIVNKCTFF